jgi:hypothetical protein
MSSRPSERQRARAGISPGPGSRIGPSARPGWLSIVAVDALAAFVALLGLDRQRRDGSGVETAQADRLAGLLAIAVGALLDAASAASILAISLRWRSRVRSSSDRSVSFEARSATSASAWFSSCRFCSVSRLSLRISSFQSRSLRRKYSFCLSFMNGSSSDGWYSYSDGWYLNSVGTRRAPQN